MPHLIDTHDVGEPRASIQVVLRERRLLKSDCSIPDGKLVSSKTHDPAQRTR